MKKFALAMLLGCLVGAGCGWLGLPCPSPPSWIGALLVSTMTAGYLVGGRLPAVQAREKRFLGGA